MVINSTRVMCSSTLAVFTVCFFATVCCSAVHRTDTGGVANPRACPGFTENRGQWHGEALYLAHTPGLQVWLTARGIVYNHYRDVSPAANTAAHRQGHVIRMEFLASAASGVENSAALAEGPRHYFRQGADGNLQSITDVRTYSGVRIQNIYPGVDVAYYYDKGMPRYDLVLQPGADPGRIKMGFSGAETLGIAADGSLVLGTGIGEIRHAELFAYQEQAGQRRAVECRFELDHSRNSVSFKLGNYDRSRPLVIDPLMYSMYLGGAEADLPHDVAVDKSNNLYVCGETRSLNFPTTDGAYVENAVDTRPNVFVSKLSPRGERLLWSTYIIGSDTERANSLALTEDGEVIVVGATNSVDFPLSMKAVSRTLGGAGDAFLAMISNEGSNLLYSTFIGGSGKEEAYVVKRGADSSIYIGGSTSSADFLVSADAWQPEFKGGGEDAFLLRTTLQHDSLAIAYATYLGGNGQERVRDLALDADSKVYLTGWTNSANFPLRNALDAGLGEQDIFVTILGNKGAAMVFSTYYGSPEKVSETAGGIAVDSRGNIIVCGISNGKRFPLRYAMDSVASDADNGVLFKLAPNGANVIYSTYFGSEQHPDSWTTINDIAVDEADNIYLTGSTLSQTFPVSSDAFQARAGGYIDAYIAMIDAAERPSLVYATYFGGAALDEGLALAVSEVGNVFLTGRTLSTANSFPLLNPPARLAQYGGNQDGFLARFKLSVDLEHPDGGETLCRNEAVEIRWRSVNRIGSITLVLRDERTGTVVDTIARNIPAAPQAYTWHIRGRVPGGSSYSISVYDDASGNAIDRTDGLFAIHTLPEVLYVTGDTAVCPETAALLRAEAVGYPEPQLLYWEARSPDNLVWVKVEGSEGESIVRIAPSVIIDKGYYRAVFGNSCGIVKTPETQLRIHEFTTLKIKTNSPLYVCPGDIIRLEAEPADSSLVYTWTRRNQQGTIITEKEHGPVLRIAPVTQDSKGWLYHVTYTTPKGCLVAATNSYIVRLFQSPELLEPLQAAEVCEGQTAVFDVKVEKFLPGIAGFGIDWYQSRDGGQSWEPAVYEQKDEQLHIASVPYAMDGWLFRAIVYNCSDTVESNPAELRVRTLALLQSTPADELDFGELGECDNYKERTIYLRNNNRDFLQLKAVRITQPDFLVAEPAALPLDLAPNGRDSVRIRYRPRTAGAHTAECVLEFACGLEYSYNMRGTMNNHRPVVQPAVLDFGLLAQCESRLDESTRLVNTEGPALTVHAAYAGAPFILENSLPFTLGKNESENLRIRYTPGSAGLHSAELVLLYTTARCPATDTLRVRLDGAAQPFTRPELPDSLRLALPDCHLPWDTSFSIVNSTPFRVSVSLLLEHTGLELDRSHIDLGADARADFTLGIREFSAVVANRLILDYGICGARDTITISGVLLPAEGLRVPPALDFGTREGSGSHVEYLNLENGSGVDYVLETLPALQPPFRWAEDRTPYVIPPQSTLRLPVEFNVEQGHFRRNVLMALRTACGERSFPVEVLAEGRKRLWLSLSLPRERRKIGEYFSLPVTIDSLGPQSMVTDIAGYEMVLSFNSTILTPADPDVEKQLGGGRMRILCRGDFPGESAATLAAIPFISAWGNAAETDVTLEAIRFYDAGHTEVDVDWRAGAPGSVIISDFRGPIHPGAENVQLFIDGNPASTTVELRIIGVPEQAPGHLEIFNSQGRRLYAVATSGSARVSIPEPVFGFNGVYFCRYTSGSHRLLRAFAYRK